MDVLVRVTDAVKSLRVSDAVEHNDKISLQYLVWQETRLAGIRSPVEFFDYQRISRPADLNQATSVS
jgi:PRA1 family protein 1